MSFKVLLILCLFSLISCGVKSPPKYDKSKPLPSIESKYISTDDSTENKESKKDEN